MRLRNIRNNKAETCVEELTSQAKHVDENHREGLLTKSTPKLMWDYSGKNTAHLMTLLRQRRGLKVLLEHDSFRWDISVPDFHFVHFITI
jgi:hypothetical protein